MDAVAEISALAKHLTSDNGAAVPVAVGVGCTGPVDPVRGTIGLVDLLPGWHGFPLVDALSDELALPVALENDADAAALAEWQWGAGHGAPRFVYISIGTGIGGGVVIDGALYRGVGGAHPEIGHHGINPSGPSCYCGMAGCWEVLASGTALGAHAAARGGSAWQGATAHDVFDRADQGNDLALALIKDHSRWIGLGLANVMTFFAPDRIVFGGGLMARYSRLLPAAITLAHSMTGLIPADRIVVAPAALGDDAPLIGAAETWQAFAARQGDA